MGMVMPCHLGSHDINEELRMLRREWALARAEQDPSAEATTLVTLAGLLLELGDTAAATRRIAQAHRALESAGVISERDRVRLLGEEAMAGGNLALARRIHRDAIERARELGSVERLRRTMDLGAVELSWGFHADATSTYVEAIGLARRLGARREECRALVAIGRICARLGASSTAERMFVDALLLAREGQPEAQVEAHLALGNLYEVTAPGRAMRVYAAAREIAAALGADGLAADIAKFEGNLRSRAERQLEAAA